MLAELKINANLYAKIVYHYRFSTAHTKPAHVHKKRENFFDGQLGISWDSGNPVFNNYS
jgi:hypothetical protein